MSSGLESAVLKVDRAMIHIDSIKAAIERYAANDPGKIVRRPDGKSTLDFSVEPDVEIAILAGEAIYQIKSALDHLAFDLVKVNARGIQLPRNWVKRCAFPLLLEVPVSGNPPVTQPTPLPYNYFSDSLPGISNEAYTFIERVQPYYRTNTANILRPLEQLSNIDKHRHLHVLRPQAYHVTEFYGSKNILSVNRRTRGAELKPEIAEELIREKDAVYTQTVMHPSVTFDEEVLGPNAAAISVDNLLLLCVNELRTIIIPRFKKFIESS